MDQLRLVQAMSDEEIERAAHFRRQVFLDRRRVVFDELLESRRDREGHVFLLLEGSTMVATGRILPYPSALSPVLSLNQNLAVDADSEIGRIASVPSPRALSYALVMLTLGSIWLLQHTRRQHYLAYCHPKLVELYRLVGAEDIGHACIVPGRSEPHRIVSGSYEDAARLGARLLCIPTTPEREPLRRTA